MPNLFSRNALQTRLATAFQSSEGLLPLLPATKLSDSLKKWLSRLMLLYGVPINYLVPDERMLPPESIRFFYLDMNWVDALIDGAFSIGRNLTTTENATSTNLDAALTPTVQQQSLMQVTNMRATALGTTAPEASLQVVSGFLLRSSIVSAYKG